MKLSVVSLLFLVTLFIIGCSQVLWRAPKQNGSVIEPITRYVCIDLPAEQVPPVKEAVEAWSTALHQWMVLRPVTASDDGCGCDYLIQETTNTDPNDKKTVAWTSMVGGRLIYMIKDRYESDPRAIALHELGHALGAQHVAGTIMNESYLRGTSCPDVTTVAQVAAWNRVDLALLSWCVQ